MIRHVVTFVLKPGTSAEVLDDFETALRRLPAVIPELLSYEFGRDLGLRDGNGSFAVVATLADVGDVPRYMDHPEHVRVSKHLIAPHVESKIPVQFALDDSHS